jgi:hypothetical protein
MLCEGKRNVPRRNNPTRKNRYEGERVARPCCPLSREEEEEIRTKRLKNEGRRENREWREVNLRSGYEAVR